MDEEIIEVMAKGLVELHAQHLPLSTPEWEEMPDIQRGQYRNQALAALAALRAEGFDIYRPGECEPVIEDTVYDDESEGAVIVYRTAHHSEGTYRLVPAERGEQA